MDSMDVHQLNEKFKQLASDEIILDVRTPEEYEIGHIPNSLNIPLDSLRSRFEELNQYSKIYVHCKMGGRAKKATEDLHKLGLLQAICVAQAGMQMWIEEGYPVVQGA